MASRLSSSPPSTSMPRRTASARRTLLVALPLAAVFAVASLGAGPREVDGRTARIGETSAASPSGTAGDGGSSDVVGEREGDGSGALRAPRDPRVDSARVELRVGRYFHASELLKAADRDGALLDGDRFLLAEAEAGYRNWRGVIEVLEGAAWAVDEPAAPALLARAHEELGHRDEAIAWYRASLERDAERVAQARLDGVDLTADRRVRQARLARLHFREGDRGSGMALVDLLADSTPILGTATMLDALDGSIEAGDSAFVRQALLRITVPGERDRLWQARARSVLAAGDTARALEMYEAHASPAGGLVEVRRTIALEVLGNLALARGDTATAVELHRRGFELTPDSNTGARSARTLVDAGPRNAEDAARLGRAMDRLGDGRRALAAYDAHLRLAAAEGRAPEDAIRVERARLMATVPSRIEEAVEEYRALDEHPDARIGARVLELWAGLRRRQGQTSNEATLREWLIQRYPDTDAAAQIVFNRADRAHDRREWDRALELYGQVAAMAPTRSQAGFARMRAGQIHLTRGNVEAAERVFSDYLSDFPDGRRWEEASYWTARTRTDLGDTASVGPLLERLREEEPFGYYTVVTGELIGERFEIPALPAGSLETTPATRRWIEEVELLDAAGFEEVADRHVDRAIEAVERSDDPDARLTLAHALNELGRTIDGINLGWALRREGMPWSHTLLSIVYPFPFREMIEREAAEWGLDPILVGALIRQESAFVEDIRSSAGAIGLMQVMPATGAEVARAVGPANFTTASLETAEVNLHLGARFLIEMLGRFGPELPLVLSAYNAGPTRADRWKNFPEISELDRFTERIPFAETRGYVKNITRNLAIYRAIYGERAVLQ